MKRKAAMVYYVEFGGMNPGVIGKRVSDGHRQEDTGKEVALPKGLAFRRRSEAPGRTMSTSYSFKEVSKLFGIAEKRLRYWDKSGLLSPSGHNGRRRCFTFQDLIGLRSVKTLLDNGISLQRTRRIVGKLKEALPKSAQPLGKLRIMADAKTVVVADAERNFEADTGQLLLDFDVKSFEKEVVSEFPDKSADERVLSAYEWYLEGCRLDETEETLSLAATLANAYTNLGNLLYRTGSVEDAKALYRKATEVDVNQPEAHYNLGFLEFEADRLETAKQSFEKAVELDNTFADAHFNLAITLYRLGETAEAKRRLETYLSLEPTGPWADVARQRLHELGQ
jgi:DNA-binding transcriptional MerR regulator